MRKFFCTCLLVFMKESVRAEQFRYVKHALQYVNGHAEDYLQEGNQTQRHTKSYPGYDMGLY